jgi:hypothetical protein
MGELDDLRHQMSQARDQRTRPCWTLDGEISKLPWIQAELETRRVISQQQTILMRRGNQGGGKFLKGEGERKKSSRPEIGEQEVGAWPR